MAKQQTKKTMQIPAIQLGVMRVQIKGLSDLIMHAWDEKVLKQIADKQQHNATARTLYDKVATDTGLVHYQIALER